LNAFTIFWELSFLFLFIRLWLLWPLLLENCLDFRFFCIFSLEERILNLYILWHFHLCLWRSYFVKLIIFIMVAFNHLNVELIEIWLCLWFLNRLNWFLTFWSVRIKVIRIFSYFRLWTDYLIAFCIKSLNWLILSYLWLVTNIFFIGSKSRLLLNPWIKYLLLILGMIPWKSHLERRRFASVAHADLSKIECIIFIRIKVKLLHQFR
jgi:hypothetical protein